MKKKIKEMMKNPEFELPLKPEIERRFYEILDEFLKKGFLGFDEVSNDYYVRKGFILQFIAS
jgi:hypothetical protein